ncbi:MAG: MarR family transcriptional regulator [Corynebacteriales bacterium]|nr:MarR family transcriptional regulator [Mycobacteriales bacterium]
MGVIDEQELLNQWRDLLKQHANTWCQLDKKLHTEHGISASAFEALDRLVEKPHTKLRIQELADEIHLSQSALSRLVAQLEKEGLVERAMCESDRRGIWVRLTPAGLERHAAAKPLHRSILASTGGPCVEIN